MVGVYIYICICVCIHIVYTWGPKGFPYNYFSKLRPTYVQYSYMDALGWALLHQLGVCVYFVSELRTSSQVNLRGFIYAHPASAAPNS